MRIFQKKIWDFYTNNKRGFPWRETTNPYHILISEVMLQQTQANRVVSKYQEFISAFPTIQDLAKATNIEVLRVWSGLGYNRRALYLKKTADLITKNRQGDIPLDPKVLHTFSGIGLNTAGSIYVFSTNKPYVFIETNIRRVFIHEFFKDQATVHDTEILELVEKTMERKNPREWYYALMDYGAYLGKKGINPNKKSKHYTNQSKFEGSIRQTRGKILKILLHEKSINKNDLKKKIATKHFENALFQLVKEEFLFIENDNLVRIS